MNNHQAGMKGAAAPSVGKFDLLVRETLRPYLIDDLVEIIFHYEYPKNIPADIVPNKHVFKIVDYLNPSENGIVIKISNVYVYWEKDYAGNVTLRLTIPPISNTIRLDLYNLENLIIKRFILKCLYGNSTVNLCESGLYMAIHEMYKNYTDGHSGWNLFTIPEKIKKMFDIVKSRYHRDLELSRHSDLFDRCFSLTNGNGDLLTNPSYNWPVIIDTDTNHKYTEQELYTSNALNDNYGTKQIDHYIRINIDEKIFKPTRGHPILSFTWIKTEIGGCRLSITPA